MKNIFAKALIFTMLLALMLAAMSVTAFAASELTVVSDKDIYEVNPGETFEIALTVEEGYTFALFTLRADFAAPFTFEGNTNGDFGSPTVGSPSGAKQFVFTESSGENFAQGLSELITLKFKADETAILDDYTISLSSVECWDKDNGAVAVDISDITVKVVCPHEDTEADNGTAATCMQTGFTAGVYCNDCTTWISGHDVIQIDENNHVDTTADGGTEATCVSTGFTAGVYCNDCTTWISGHTLLEINDNHDYGDFEPYDDEQHIRLCQRDACANKEDYEDHEWDNGVITVRPSNGNDGEKLYTCEVCGDTKTAPYKGNNLALAVIAAAGKNKYENTAEASEYGMIIMKNISKKKGDTVTFTAAPKLGFKVKSVSVKFGDKNIEVTDLGDNKFSFVQPAGSVKIIGEYEKLGEKLVLTIGSKIANVFGVEVENDVAPVIVNSRALLPARFIAENLGATVAWDGAAGKATISANGVVIELYVNSTTAYVNGVAVTLDSPAIILGDRVFTPVRFIAENLGAAVEWDAATSQAIITK